MQASVTNALLGVTFHAPYCGLVTKETSHDFWVKLVRAKPNNATEPH